MSVRAVLLVSVPVLGLAAASILVSAPAADAGRERPEPPQVVRVSPSAFPRGRPILVTAAGLSPARRYRVYLRRDASGNAKREKVVKLKLLEQRNTGLSVTLRRRTPAGTYGLFVHVRGGDPVRAPDTVEVLGPMIDDADEETQGGKRIVVIQGENFGPRRGKVFAGPAPDLEAGASKRPKGGMRRTKVLSWTDDEVRVRLHRKTPEGDLSLLLDNRVGTATGTTVPSELDSVVDELPGIVVLGLRAKPTQDREAASR